MEKRTEYLIFGIAMASILAGIYGAVRTGELMESLSGILIGAALIGTVIIERNKKNKTE
tara:strand:+ start:335 stop:511 length:177 start_codon:yes stop_codon:yes gene_type:complete